MQNITLALLCTTMMIFSCNKENGIEKETNYVDTDYYPGSSEKVKEEILEFLAATNTYNNAIAKTNLLGLNRNPSEGKWLMEGASNFLTNVNLNLGTDTVIEIDIEIDNLIANDGSILMDGADMVAEFDNLHNNIASIENTIGKTAKILDYEISTVSSLRTGIKIKTIFGLNLDLLTLNEYPNDINPVDLFEQYEIDLKDEFGTPSNTFYTNVEYNGILPYTHNPNVNDPNYYPQQDPNSPLFDASLEKCGTNHLGQTDCNVCYDCLFSDRESTFGYYNNSTGTWSADKADYYYDGTKTVIENFIDNGNHTSGLVDVNITLDFFVCGCINDGSWQKLDIVLGNGSSY